MQWHFLTMEMNFIIINQLLLHLEQDNIVLVQVKNLNL